MQGTFIDCTSMPDVLMRTARVALWVLWVWAAPLRGRCKPSGGPEGLRPGRLWGRLLSPAWPGRRDSSASSDTVVAACCTGARDKASLKTFVEDQKRTLLGETTE
jgi:hypothetical protein